MTSLLTVDDFAAFFHEVHGYPPFPWQSRLLRNVAEEGRWPEVLDLPTGSGKTAALDAAVFHLALEADRGSARRAPVRIALVVDRRLVVDDAFKRAKKIEEALADSGCGPVTSRVAKSLRQLSGNDAPPLLARRLRGGIPRESSWARTPSQPTILCSTVDQVGSRLLFRGYGVSDRMKPVHAGLIGTDCLILLDEAHLSEPFRQTLGWVARYKSDAWREDRDAAAPWSVALLTATPGEISSNTFHLEEDDRRNEILAARLKAPKMAFLVEAFQGKHTEEFVAPDDDGKEEDKKAEDWRLINALVETAQDGLKALQRDQGKRGFPALALVVNRVARARATFDELGKHLNAEAADLILLIGPSREVDRDILAERLKQICTGKARDLPKPLVLVATQCIEAGVDIDLDGLVTEAAPIDALRQRFGRLNRDGRDIKPYSAILGGKTHAEDPVYGRALSETWKYLTANPDEKENAKVDFGLTAFEKRIAAFSSNEYEKLLSPKLDAPVFLPAHLDLLSQTSPVPVADPDISLYLHGPNRAADSVSIIWRADISPEFQQSSDVRRLLMLVPPRSAEAIELPLWALRRWLTGQRTGFSALADIPGLDSDKGVPSNNKGKGKVFRWAGDDDHSRWIDPKEILPGDTVIVPANYGGIDKFGWNPNSSRPATDVAYEAATPFESRHFAVRVAPGLLGENGNPEALAEAIAASDTGNWKELKDAIKPFISSERLIEALNKLHRARGKVQTHSDLYGENEDRPRGIVFLAPFGLKDGAKGMDDSPDTTEDDVSGSLPGFPLPLEQHCTAVEEMAGRLAALAGLTEDRIFDLRLAGYLHDSGKVDARFQEWLAYDDPLGFDPDCTDGILAKSARPLPRNSRVHSGLPKKWRHEALSVRLAPLAPRFAEASDPELVLWLIGTHHGHGRPFFPHGDPEDEKARERLPKVLGILSTLPSGHGPQSLAYCWDGLDWSGLYARLKTRYGVWDLARMEAILRLADHRASEAAERRAREKEVKDQ